MMASLARRLERLEADANAASGVVVVQSPACPPDAPGQAAFDAWADEQRRRHAGAPGLLVMVRRFFSGGAPVLR